MADERLQKAEQLLAEANRRADDATRQVEEIRVRAEAMERVRIEAEMTAKRSEDLRREANEQLLEAVIRAKKAEQLAMEKIKDADGRVIIQAEIIAKRSEALSKEANEQLLASIARAEKAEQQSAEKISEAEKKIQKAVESAQQLEQKFMDAMERMKGGSSGKQQRLNLELDKKLNMDVANDVDARQWLQWRPTREEEVLDDEDVEKLLQPCAEITESSDLIGEINEGPDSAEDEDTGMRLEDRGVDKGKQKMVNLLNFSCVCLA